MTLHTQPSETNWPKEQKSTQSHRWIVHLLAEMVHYSETHELHSVVGPLTDAIERIAPSLAGDGRTPVGLNRNGSDQAESEAGNILSFTKRGIR